MARPEKHVLGDPEIVLKNIGYFSHTSIGTIPSVGMSPVVSTDYFIAAHPIDVWLYGCMYTCSWYVSRFSFVLRHWLSYTFAMLLASTHVQMRTMEGRGELLAFSFVILTRRWKQFMELLDKSLLVGRTSYLITIINANLTLHYSRLDVNNNFQADTTSDNYYYYVVVTTNFIIYISLR